MSKCAVGMKLTTACSVPVDDIPDGISSIFLNNDPDFMKEMELMKKAESDENITELEK